jgi:hypothetical protein
LKPVKSLKDLIKKLNRLEEEKQVNDNEEDKIRKIGQDIKQQRMNIHFTMKVRIYLKHLTEHMSETNAPMKGV